MDKFKIDSQKISYFPERIGAWKEAQGDWQKMKKVYPIYMEVSPASGCNHRCIFCALDYLEHKPGFLNYESYLDFVKVASDKGVKSIMFGGEGEPLLHPKISEMVIATKNSGIDTAFTTNGTLLNEVFLKKTLKYINWIKISLDAGKSSTHSKIHRTSERDYNNIIKNIECAVALRNQKKYSCSIGVQLLLLPQNYDEVLTLAKKMKKIGVDYFVVKPYSQGLFSENKFVVDYKKYAYLEEKVNKLSSENFSAVFRSQAFARSEKNNFGYKKCLAVPFFWGYLMTDGDIYTCSAFLGKKEFIIGNINQDNFAKIWEGEKRKANYEMMKKFSIKNCRENCRMDKVNLYLNDIINPPQNFTFI